MSDSFLPSPASPTALSRAAPLPMAAAEVPRSPSARDAAAWTAAQAMETAFLAEMLGEAGLGAMTGPFSGGIGEEQFSSFLRQEQASALVRKGGVGLSEQIYNALVKREAP